MGWPSNHRRRTGPIPNLALGISVVLWVLLTWAGYRCFATDQATSGLWGCEMAYMHPSFLPLEGVDNTGSQYALYLYREGGMDPPTPSGVPVIFIPGNAGSYKQARSIGASTATQFHKGREATWTKNIDLFTVDFNEDLSALHAPTLRSQAEFLVKAIARVLKAYDHLSVDERPTKVSLLGHSMGGIVARLATTLVQPTMSKPSPVDVILTMSTPHLQPPASLDHEMEQIYHEINSVTYSDPAPLLVSICGGTSDVQIVSDACALSDSLVGPDDGFAVYSTGIPGVWTGVEHQAMVWCDQVRFRVARTLLDMGESASRQGKLAAAKQWLLGQSGRIQTLPTLDATTRIDDIATSMSVMVKMTYPTERSLVDPPLDARFCRAKGDCVEQTFLPYTIPWLAVSEQPFPLLGEGSRSEDSIFVLDLNLPNTSNGWLEIHHPLGASVFSGRLTSQEVSGVRWKSGGRSADSTHLALHFPSPTMSSVIAYRLTVETEQCSDRMATVRFTSSPGTPFYNPSHESRFFPLHGGSVTLHSHISGSPFQGFPQSTQGVHLDIFQHPRCRIRSLSLSVDRSATLAKAILRLRIAILAWCIGWVAVILFLQLNQYASHGTIPSFSEVVSDYGGRLGLGAVGVSTLVLITQHAGAALAIPTGRLFLGLTRVTYLPLMLLAVAWSWGVVAVVYVVQQVFLSILGRVLHPAQEKSDPRVEKTSGRWAIGSRIALGALVLGLIGFAIPYRLVFGILLLLQFTLTAYASAEGSPSRLHLLETVLLLMTLLLPINLPSLAVWGKNVWIHGRHPFPEDRAILPILPALVMVLVTSFERPLTAPTRVRQAAKWTAALIAVGAFMFAPSRTYIVGPVVNVAFILASVLMASPGEQ